MRSTNAAAAKAGSARRLGLGRVRATSSRTGSLGRLGLVACVMALVGLGFAGAASASCNIYPNYYAAGLAAGGGHHGLRGYIEATSVYVPQQNEDFSDQSWHAVGPTYGLEVGLYTGWGGQTHTYVTSPHAYATLNGPDEVDGPSVYVGSDYFYSTYWSGSTQIWNVRVYFNQSLVWSGTQNAFYSGPGPAYGWGETDNNTLTMNGQFDGVNTGGPFQYYSSDGAWDSWTGISFCADSPYGIDGDKTVNDFADYTG